MLIKMSDKKRISYTGLRSDILSMISAKPSYVLDVGCSNGIFLEYAKKGLGASYTVGVEIDSDLSREAMQRADQIINADLDCIKGEQIGIEKFDLILFADVLEHTKEPASVLREILKTGTQDVHIIISLPNIQHWTAIKNLIIGEWPLRERGLFDKTHLRFFTLRSIVTLAEECGLKVEKVHRNYRIMDSPSSCINKLSRYVGFWPFASYFTYQYVIRLRRA